MKFLVGRRLTRRPPVRMVVHEISDLIMVHGDGTRADGRRSGSGAKSSQIVGSRDRRGAGAFGNRKSNVGHTQPG